MLPISSPDVAYAPAKPRADHRTLEIWSEGVDPDLQGVGTGPVGDFGNVGLRVPFLATSDKAKRYLFLLCGFYLGEGESGSIISIDTYWTLYARFATGSGGAGGPAKAEIVVGNRTFKLPDGNVSFHLRRISENYPERFVDSNGPTDLSSFRWRATSNPALLYETATLGASGFYTDITAYTPPNGGEPYGDDLGGEYTLHEARSISLASYDIPLVGPAFYGLFATVKQSSGTYSSPPVPGGGSAVGQELQFINTYGLANGDAGKSGTIIGRVYGAMIVNVNLYNNMPEQGRQPMPPCRWRPSEGGVLMPDARPHAPATAQPVRVPGGHWKPPQKGGVRKSGPPA